MVTAAERSRHYATETEIIYEHPEVPRARSSENFVLEPNGVGCFVRFETEVSQDTAPCWGPKQALNSSVADGSLDAGASGTTDPINPGAPRTIGQFRFGEAAINLTDSNILSGCAA